MVYESELEKLEQRFREKPEQWFAALADAYRRNGDLELALEIVVTWSEKRPTYTSGYIVQGRVLLDTGEDAKAAETFEKVLDLDPENIIALKSLGEIAQRKGDTEGARSWLTRLLEVDPMNEDARETLDGLGGAASTEETPSEAMAASGTLGEPGVATDDAPAEVGAGSTPDTVQGEPAAGAAAEPSGVEAGPAAVDAGPAADEAGPPEVQLPSAPSPPDQAGADEVEAPAPDTGSGIEDTVTEMPAVAPAQPVAESFTPAPTDFAAGSSVSDDAPADVGETTAEDLKPEDLAFYEEPAAKEVDFGPISDVDELKRAFEAGEAVSEVDSSLAADAPPETGPDSSLVAEPLTADQQFQNLLGSPQAPTTEPDQAPVAPEADQVPMAVEGGDVGTEPPAPAESDRGLGLILPADVTYPAAGEPEPVVTATMADLYMQQGLYDEARDIYAQLLLQDPENEELRAKLQALEEEPAQRGSAAADRRFSVAATGGESAKAMLLGIAGGASEGGAPAPKPSAQQQPPPDVGVDSSFDQFFGNEPATDTAASEGQEPTSSPPDQEDDGAFQDWLKDLKT